MGFHLCQLLSEAGAKLVVSDPLAERLQAVQLRGAQIVGSDAIHRTDADVFSPCAVGAVLNDKTIPELRVKIVAGAANNQLATFAHGNQLKDRGILYLPDYVANAGGLISCAAEWYRTPLEAIRMDVLHIYDTCIEILEGARKENVSTVAVAEAIAFARLKGSQPSTGRFGS